MTDTVHEEQSTLVADTALPADLQRTHTLLRRAGPPEGMTPYAKRNAGMLKDRSHPHGELFLARMTPPEETLVPILAPCVHDFGYVGPAAMRASRRIAPTLFLHEFNRSRLIHARLWNGLEDWRSCFTGMFDLPFHVVDYTAFWMLVKRIVRKVQNYFLWNTTFSFGRIGASREATGAISDKPERRAT
jgi:hypothetical protein